jgi:mevalonate kinase
MVIFSFPIQKPFNFFQGCAAKLTGAGGGGCAFAVLDERKDAAAQRLQLVRHICF